MMAVRGFSVPFIMRCIKIPKDRSTRSQGWNEVEPWVRFAFTFPSPERAMFNSHAPDSAISWLWELLCAGYPGLRYAPPFDRLRAGTWAADTPSFRDYFALVLMFNVLTFARIRPSVIMPVCSTACTISEGVASAAGTRLGAEAGDSVAAGASPVEAGVFSGSKVIMMSPFCHAHSCAGMVPESSRRRALI